MIDVGTCSTCSIKRITSQPSTGPTIKLPTTASPKAGATELIDGTLYARPGGRLRLDLRRTDLASGDLRTTHTAEGRDVFALVDSGTGRTWPLPHIP